MAKLAKNNRSGKLHLPAILLTSYLLLLSAHSQAGSYLLVESGQGEIYSRFRHSLQKLLTKTNNSLTTRDIDSFKSQHNELATQKYDTIVSAGLEASIAISDFDTKTPKLMSMVPKDSFYKLHRSGNIHCRKKTCQVIYLDQPVKRQLRFLKLALPEAKHITVIGSDDSHRLLHEITSYAENFGFAINAVEISDVNSVLTDLNENLANSDALMAIPDPVIYNRNTARAILLSTFHQRVPMLAYSRSFVRAGATIGIYSTPEDIARHVAEVLTNKTTISIKRQMLYPKYYSIDINQRAANALGITLPDTQSLKNKLQAYKNE